MTSADYRDGSAVLVVAADPDGVHVGIKATEPFYATGVLIPPAHPAHGPALALLAALDGAPAADDTPERSGTLDRILAYRRQGITPAQRLDAVARQVASSQRLAGVEVTPEEIRAQLGCLCGGANGLHLPGCVALAGEGD